MQVSTREANIVCIAQTTFEIINNVLLIHNGRFMFLWFDFALNLPTCVDRMDISIDLSAEITKLVSHRVRRFSHGSFAHHKKTSLLLLNKVVVTENPNNVTL